MVNLLGHKKNGLTQLLSPALSDSACGVLDLSMNHLQTKRDSPQMHKIHHVGKVSFADPKHIIWL